MTSVDVTPERSTWRPWLTFALSLFGLGVSVYLTIAHFEPSALTCPAGGRGSFINCNEVTTSAQSHFLGIPVAILGLAFYTGATIINVPTMWRSTDRRVHLARLAIFGVGMAFALYLISAEFLIIGKICIWCTSVHVITFVLFVLIISATPRMVGWDRTQAVGP